MINKIVSELIWILIGMVIVILFQSPVADNIFGQEVQTIKVYFTAEAPIRTIIETNLSSDMTFEEQFNLSQTIMSESSNTNIYDKALDDKFFPKKLELGIYKLFDDKTGMTTGASLIYIYSKDKPKLVSPCIVPIDNAIIQCTYVYTFNLEEHQTAWIMPGTISLDRITDFNEKLLNLDLITPNAVNILNVAVVIGDQGLGIPIVKGPSIEQGMRESPFLELDNNKRWHTFMYRIQGLSPPLLRKSD